MATKYWLCSKKICLIDDTIKNNILFDEEMSKIKNKLEKFYRFHSAKDFINNLPNGVNKLEKMVLYYLAAKYKEWCRRALYLNRVY